jgi:hypothetical protein
MKDDVATDERLAIQWLRDENQIQRTLSGAPSGKNSVREDDISGGHAALIRILRGSAPLSSPLRLALARALEPLGDSMLQLKKRLRRGPGRPPSSDSVRGAVVDAFEVAAYPKAVGEEIEALIKKQPQAAIGASMPAPQVIVKAVRNVGAKANLGKTKINNLRKRANSDNNALKNKTK